MGRAAPSLKGSLLWARLPGTSGFFASLETLRSFCDSGFCFPDGRATVLLSQCETFLGVEAHGDEEPGTAANR